MSTSRKSSRSAITSTSKTAPDSSGRSQPLLPLRRPLRETVLGCLFASPAAAYLLLFSVVPMLAALWLSLHRWHLLKPERPFVGLRNYFALAEDPFFLGALRTSLLFASVAVPAALVVALVVAVLVNRPLRGVALFRTLYFVPAVSSPAALAIVWSAVFLPNVGLVNATLGLLNPLVGALSLGRWRISTDTDFLGDPFWALPVLALMFVWTGLGPRMVIFLAGLQTIPQALIEAASLDGAGPWRRFRHVTLPLLLPTTLFVLVTTTIAAFQFFVPVYIITRGGPRRTTDLMAYHIYKEAWTKFEVGMASAQTYVMLALVLVLAVVQFMLLRRGMSREDAA